MSKTNFLFIEFLVFDLAFNQNMTDFSFAGQKRGRRSPTLTPVNSPISDDWYRFEVVCHDGTEYDFGFPGIPDFGEGEIRTVVASSPDASAGDSFFDPESDLTFCPSPVRKMRTGDWIPPTDVPSPDVGQSNLPAETSYTIRLDKDCDQSQPKELQGWVVNVFAENIREMLAYRVNQCWTFDIYGEGTPTVPSRPILQSELAMLIHGFLLPTDQILISGTISSIDFIHMEKHFISITLDARNEWFVSGVFLDHVPQ